MPTEQAPTRGVTGARVAVVAAVAVVVATALLAYGNRHDFFDLRIYVAAMRWWAGGHDLYDYAQPDRVQGELYFTYPPFAALLLRPLADLRFCVTIALFTAGTVAAVGATTWWLVGPLAGARGWPRWFVAGLATPLVFLIEPTRETVTQGQINMLLIVLIVGDLLLAVPRRWRLAGAGIGLATALKLFPGIFIVYLLITRRWRAAAVASAAAAAATLLAAAVAPRASWQFWTGALWDTDRVGRTDYTGNQSIQGLLSRLAVPGEAPRWLWLLLVAALAGYGLWRAARAARAGDEVAGLALTGLVAALISPITWPHHVYWFVPAVVVLVGAASAPGADRGRRWAAGLLACGVYAVAVFGVVSFVDFGAAPEPTDDAGEFLLRNAYVLVSVLLLAALPVERTMRREVPVYTRSAAE
ncbi:MAG TPA: glycosyltransferase 87 family protein [Pilimelia sp.]|nr:glycosyltransferase 87 family protein [Pilimelia sp.]